MENHYVAHFDMLGMRSLIKSNPDLAWQKLNDLSIAIDERLLGSIERLDTGKKYQIKPFIFSDTVIAFTNSDTENDAMAIVCLTADLFARSLNLCVPLRGGISYGLFKFDSNRNLFAGPALLEAYKLGESSQWLGISLDKKVAEVVSKLSISKSPQGKDMFVNWDVPIKNEKCENLIENRIVLNWPESHRNNYKLSTKLNVETFYQLFSELFGPFENLKESDKVKYENTVSFFNAHYTGLTI